VQLGLQDLGIQFAMVLVHLKNRPEVKKGKEKGLKVYSLLVSFLLLVFFRKNFIKSPRILKILDSLIFLNIRERLNRLTV